MNLLKRFRDKPTGTANTANISSSENKPITEHWDDHVRRVENTHQNTPDSVEYRGWLDWEFIDEEYVRPQISGSRTIDYFGHFLLTHVPSRPVGRALSMGCGGGNLERAMIAWNAAEQIDAFDFSPESIRVAIELAREQNLSERLHYEVKDANQIQLPPATYDFVIAKMSLHHFENLEGIYEQVRQTLKPGGVFMFNEFVGPTRFQWTDLQLELMKELITALPQQKRWSAVNKAMLIQMERATIEQMMSMDPTEAVRSAEIMPLLENYFEIIEYRPYGGTLVNNLLTHTMGNFDLKNEDQVALLHMIFLFERTLIRFGLLPSDFAYVVARPK